MNVPTPKTDISKITITILQEKEPLSDLECIIAAILSLKPVEIVFDPVGDAIAAAKALIAEELKAKELIAEEVLAKETLAKELLAKEALANDILAKELATEELLADELAAEEPAAEEPAAEEPAAEDLEEQTTELAAEVESAAEAEEPENQEDLENLAGDLSDETAPRPAMAQPDLYPTYRVTPPSSLHFTLNDG
jgi:hypothetical protein